MPMPGAPVVSLNLSAEQRSVLDAARAHYLCDGEPMAHLDIYLIRFLCAMHWKLTSTCKEQLSRAAIWRKESGANEYRRRLAVGEAKFGDHPLVASFIRAHVVLPQQGETHNGDRIKLRELGTLNVPYFLSAITDEQAIAFVSNQLEADAFDADAHSAARGHLVRWAQFSLLAGLGLQHVKPRMLGRLKAVAPIIEVSVGCPKRQRATVLIIQVGSVRV